MMMLILMVMMEMTLRISIPLLESNEKYRVKERRRYSDQNTSVAKDGGQQQCTVRMHRRVIYHTNALLKANVPRSDGTRRHRVRPLVDMRLDPGP